MVIGHIIFHILKQQQKYILLITDSAFKIRAEDFRRNGIKEFQRAGPPAHVWTLWVDRGNVGSEGQRRDESRVWVHHLCIKGFRSQCDKNHASIHNHGCIYLPVILYFLKIG
jgi:hypothetical protein